MEKLGIYIHIPFCIKKCNYCDFLSAPATRQVQNLYMEALLNEIELYKEELSHYIVDTIFIGGGTPSAVEPEWIEKIIGKLKTAYKVEETCEISMEMNPGTITKESAQLYKKAGINRVSLGLQSADNALLQKLGRIHTWESFLQSYELVKEAGFTNINIDMMSALPGQTLEGYKAELTKVLALNPTHISAYSLIVEEGTPFYALYEAGKLELPEEDTEREMYYQTDALLQKAGYERYEISNYARPGFACRHNEGYWQRKNYAGFGIGAASLLTDYQDASQCIARRYKNTDNINAYIEKNGNTLENQALREQEKLTQKDAMEEFMFLGLRMMEGVSKEQFQTAFSKPIESVYGNVIEKLIEEGVLQEKKDRIMLTGRGIDVSNMVLAEFLIN